MSKPNPPHAALPPAAVTDTAAVKAIRARIAKLEAEREKFITSANAQVGNYNVGIGELKLLIGELPQTDDAPQNDQNNPPQNG